MEEFNPFAGSKAILFDYDNTLVNSKPVFRKAIQAVSSDIYNFLKDNGQTLISPELLEQKLLHISEKLDSEGVYDRNMWWIEVLKQIGISDIEKEQLFEWTSLYWSIAGETLPFEDALDILTYLKQKGYRIGLVTNSDGEGGDKKSRIAKFPFIDKFDVIVIGGENNVRPKPSVQPFILACEELKAKGNECVMVGDDPVKDCLAAKKAGLKSILIDRDSSVKYPELYADFVVSSLKELEEFL